MESSWPWRRARSGRRSRRRTPSGAPTRCLRCRHVRPQGLTKQVATLAAVGAEVHRSNANATDERWSCRSSPMSAPTTVVSVGADLFATAVADQAVPVTSVDWRPPMPGTEADLAVVATDPLRRSANEQALARMLDVQAMLVDVRPASDVLQIERGTFLHAGPPIEWDRRRPAPRRADGWRRTRRTRRRPGGLRAALRVRRRGHPGAVPPPRRRRPDGGRGHPVDVDVRAGGPQHREAQYCSLNEGLGKVLRDGPYSPDVIQRLRWMSTSSGRFCRRRCNRRGRSTQPASSRRCCRWATRRTTATGPAP